MYHMASTSKPNGVILHTPWTLHHLMESDVLFGNIRLIVWVCSNCIQCHVSWLRFMWEGYSRVTNAKWQEIPFRFFLPVIRNVRWKIPLAVDVIIISNSDCVTHVCHLALAIVCQPKEKPALEKNLPLSEPTGIFARKTFDLELFNIRTESSVGRGTESVLV